MEWRQFAPDIRSCWPGMVSMMQLGASICYQAFNIYPQTVHGQDLRSCAFQRWRPLIRRQCLHQCSYSGFSLYVEISTGRAESTEGSMPRSPVWWKTRYEWEIRRNLFVDWKFTQREHQLILIDDISRIVLQCRGHAQRISCKAAWILQTRMGGRTCRLLSRDLNRSEKPPRFTFCVTG